MTSGEDRRRRGCKASGAAWAGVPMLCFPLLTDQVTNRWLVMRKWRVGMPIRYQGAVFADEVRARIKGVVSGKEGEELREAVKKVRATLEVTTAHGGPLQRSFDEFNDKLTRALRWMLSSAVNRSGRSAARGHRGSGYGCSL
ncbi:UDP-glycosyltransferase 86A1-like [Triticum aestivum]|uniref:UDP-glycosyltransferase 86A1-like n=1 Tax=Triticum aestivum TaxID=4565 RepID=UPI001D01B203|nr:UDP-glycosyltransferase 86A1-like [Triticum aestivum]